LVENEYDPLMIAAAALKIARKEEKQRPLSKVSEVREARPKKSRTGDNRDTNGNGWNGFKNSVEKGMVRLSISAGKKHGVRPADIVGSIAYHADFPGNSIGAINILDKHTLVDVPQQYVEQLLAKAGKYRLRKNTVKLELT
jgi:ATP-dependent RNA helicase DeaD